MNSITRDDFEQAVSWLNSDPDFAVDEQIENIMGVSARFNEDKTQVVLSEPVKCGSVYLKAIRMPV
ncbi:MAG: hypothetical protein ACPG05_05200 [Bdellovibrionales bacterium]